jgi:signal transduction histidine kinase
MRLISHAGFTLLASLALAVCLHVQVGTFELVGSPFVGFTLTYEGVINAVGLEVWGADQAGLRSGDRVVAVDGQLTFSGPMVNEHALSGTVGRLVTYQVEGIDGSQRFVQLPSRIFTAAELLKSHTVIAPIGLLFVVIAILLYVLRPATWDSWAFFLFFASLGVCLASVVDDTILWRLPTINPMLGPFVGAFGLLLVGVVTRSLRATGRTRIFMRSLLAVAFVISAAISLAHYMTLGDHQRFYVVDHLMFSWYTVATVTCLTILVVAYRRERSPRRRARLRQILWAWPVGAGIPTVNLFVGQVLLGAGGDISPLWNGFLVLVPLSTADAIIRHDLLQLTHGARRLIGGMTVAAVVGIGLGAVMWAASQFLYLTEAAGMIALAAILFAVGSPIAHRVQRTVDKLLQSAPYDPGRLVAKFTARASTAQHLADVKEELGDTLETSVHPERFELFRLGAGDGRLWSTGDAGASILVDDALEEMLRAPEALVFDDEVAAHPALGEDATVAVPLAVAGDPVGLFVLAPRKNGRPYEAGDVAFVASLGGPMAAALVSTRAYEEVAALNLALEARVEERTHELSAKNDELARLNERKDELVATVSHDFRSPLAVIRQNAQTALRDMRDMDEEDLRFFLEGIARQERRLTDMCENLLDLARLKETEAPDEEVSLLEVARSLVAELEPRAGERGVALELDCEDGEARTRGDKGRLGQVLQNLVDNAIKFSEDGGTVTVRLKSDDDEISLSVEDDGCGIPAEDLPRLFEPFYQVPRTAHAGQGSGLGLAIVKAIVESHGGDIDVDSEEERGTRFTVRLPIA